MEDTTKLKVVEAIRKEGFDFWTACEEYERIKARGANKRQEAYLLSRPYLNYIGT